VSLIEHDEFLNSVYHIARKGGVEIDLQLRALLRLGCDRFGMDIGVITHVEGDSFSILASHEPDSDHFPEGKKDSLEGTACAMVIKDGGLVCIDNTSDGMKAIKSVPIPFVRYVGIPVRVDGQIIGTLCFFRTQHREEVDEHIGEEQIGILMLVTAALIERRLHLDSEQQLRQVASIVECSEDAIFTESLDRVILSWNAAAERLTGYSAQEIIGKSANIMYPGGDGDYVNRLMEKVARGQRTDSIDAVHIRKDGKHINTSFNLSPIRDKDGQVVAASVVVRDIDERIRVQEALAKSEQRYALAARGSNDGLWDWDMVTNEVYYSPRLKSILGYGEDEIAPTIEAWTDLILDADMSQFNANLAIHLAGRAEQLYNEHRVVTRGGEERWVLCRGVAVRDDQGQALRIAGSLTDITRQKHAEAELINQARQDKLTGLPNRLLFTEVLHAALARSRRNSTYKFAVLFLDFDRFKVINDSLGHEYGDMLLINIAQQLRVQLRTVDTAARIGGDEFVVLLDGIDGLGGAIEVAERLLSTFSSPHSLGGHEVMSTASIGIVTSDGDYSKPDEMIRDADTAMYQAKAAGRARYVVFDEQMHAKALQRLNLEKDMRKAIVLRQMWIAYQPIVSLENGTLRGFEALLRWDHPELGPIGPEEFISIAEETGEIVTIGDWVLDQACRQLVAWKKAYPAADDLFMNVNISKRQVVQPDVAANLSGIFEASGVVPGDIRLEITESVIMDERSEITPVLNNIRSLGVQLAMDDFGTGHSSLSCLHRFPINVLKIDHECIKNMEQQIEYTAVIQAIVTLAHALGISVVAEGLDSADQVAQLQALECDLAQGYYFSKPLTVQAATEHIINAPHHHRRRSA
jgi:diguanylate cyclase (GGDEF)-like protein/PAS domain S-box-containing protein